MSESELTVATAITIQVGLHPITLIGVLLKNEKKSPHLDVSFNGYDLSDRQITGALQRLGDAAKGATLPTPAKMKELRDDAYNGLKARAEELAPHDISLDTHGASITMYDLFTGIRDGFTHFDPATMLAAMPGDLSVAADHFTKKETTSTPVEPTGAEAKWLGGRVSLGKLDFRHDGDGKHFALGLSIEWPTEAGSPEWYTGPPSLFGDLLQLEKFGIDVEATMTPKPPKP